MVRNLKHSCSRQTDSGHIILSCRTTQNGSSLLSSLINFWRRLRRCFCGCLCWGFRRAAIGKVLLRLVSCLSGFRAAADDGGGFGCCGIVRLAKLGRRLPKKTGVSRHSSMEVTRGGSFVQEGKGFCLRELMLICVHRRWILPLLVGQPSSPRRSTLVALPSSPPGGSVSPSERLASSTVASVATSTRSTSPPVSAR